MSEVQQVKLIPETETIKGVYTYGVNAQPLEFLGRIILLSDGSFELAYSPMPIKEYWNSRDLIVIEYKKGFCNEVSALGYLLTKHSSADQSKSDVLQVIKNS